MAESIYHKQKGIFAALETTEGTYVAPTATAFILTENLAITPINAVNDSSLVYADDVGEVQVEKLATRHSTLTFDVPHSWPAVAPGAAAGFLPIAPLLEMCGSQAGAYTVGPPARHTYAELASTATAKSGSISMRRRRTATHQLERRMAGTRGMVGFSWEIGKIPRWAFEMLGSHTNMSAQTNLASTAGTQLTNMDKAAATGTVGLITLGTQALCLTKYSNPNLFRLSPEWVQFLCGARAQPKAKPDNDIVVTAKFPNIDTEFNPDTYLNNEYALTFRLVQAGGGRSMQFLHPTVMVMDYKEVELGDELGIEMTLRQTSRITMTTE